MNKQLQDQHIQGRIAESDAKLSRMRQQLEALQWEIALEEDVRAVFVKKLGHEPLKIVTGAGSLKAAPSQINGGGSIGFADAVKTALRGKYLPSRLVTEAIRASGFPYTATTPLSVRVHNELSRLVKNGVAKRDADGNFSLA